MAKKTYTIIAIRDDYVKINILAKSKEEAIEKAKNDDHDSQWVSYQLGDFNNFEYLGAE